MSSHARLESLFSPPVRAWFEARYDGPTEVQLEAWREIAGGHAEPTAPVEPAGRCSWALRPADSAG